MTNDQKQMAKRLPCKTCGIKPAMIINQLGYSDKDDQYTLQCRKCKKVIEADYNLTPKGQEYNVVMKWNKENL